MPKRKMTAKQRVLRRYRKAFCWKDDFLETWWVYKDEHSAALGTGKTSNAAWADAARRIGGKR